MNLTQDMIYYYFKRVQHQRIQRIPKEVYMH